jgi:hypothetical protein
VDELDVLQEMKKALIGNCPVCGSRQVVLLSSILEAPIGDSRKCYSCLTPLRIADSRPILKFVVENGIFLLIIAAIFLGDLSNNNYFLVIMFCLALMPAITNFIGRFLWNPVLITVSKNPLPKIDLLREEASIASPQAQQAAEQDASGNRR